MPRGPAAAYAAGTFDEARLHMVEAKLEEAARYEEACLRRQRAAQAAQKAQQDGKLGELGAAVAEAGAQ